MSIDHLSEHVAKVIVGFDAIEFAGFDERTEHRPARSAAIASGKKVVLATERDGANRTLNRVRIELNATVMEEARQPIPTRESVPHRLGKLGATGQQRELGLQPKPEVIDVRLR